MPRIPRCFTLDNDHQTHKMWSSHDKDWNISTFEEKAAYMDSLNKFLKKQSNELNVFTLMSNHTHEIYDILNKEEFSNLMRNHHSRYGMWFNRKHQRRGKVAYERPKTCLIEDDEYSMRATFYIHANPVRAGITKNAASYRWSTHNLYAFGKRDEFTKNVRFPGWYMELGGTWEDRQRKYRQLFDFYLEEEGLIKQEFLQKRFFGSMLWTTDHAKEVSDWLKSRSGDPP